MGYRTRARIARGQQKISNKHHNKKLVITILPAFLLN
jgi:hypothetical protein